MRNNIQPDIEDIFKSIEPHETYKFYNIEYIRSIEADIPCYKKMICCDAFKEYLVKPVNGKIKKKFTPV